MINNILITGGTGMVGQNLQVSFKKANLSGIFVGRENGKYDLTNYEKTKQLFSDTRPNIVIHCGANVGGIGYNLQNPAPLIRDNVLMGFNILDACVEYQIENLYITSTCCSYPKFCPQPMKEINLYDGAEELSNSFYGLGKKTIIKASQAYRKQYGLKSTCFILANLYGFYDNFDLESSHVVPALIRKFIYAKEMNLPYVECWGTGNASRDLFFVRDLTEILTRIVMDHFDYSEPINLGTSRDILIKDVAVLIKELTGFTGKIVFTGNVSDGQPRRCLDITRANQLLNWQPTITLEQGLKETIDWYLTKK